MTRCLYKTFWHEYFEELLRTPAPSPVDEIHPAKCLTWFGLAPETSSPVYQNRRSVNGRRKDTKPSETSWIMQRMTFVSCKDGKVLFIHSEHWVYTTNTQLNLSGFKGKRACAPAHLVSGPVNPRIDNYNSYDPLIVPEIRSTIPSSRPTRLSETIQPNLMLLSRVSRSLTQSLCY